MTGGTAVGNDETWPADLERLTGRRVLYAGVRGYGLDQIVVRAERMVPELRGRHHVGLPFGERGKGHRLLGKDQLLDAPNHVAAGGGNGGDMPDRSSSDEPGCHGFESPPKVAAACVALRVPHDLGLEPSRALANRDDALLHRRLRAFVKPGFHAAGLGSGRLPPTHQARAEVSPADRGCFRSQHGRRPQGWRGSHFEVLGGLLDLLLSSPVNNLEKGPSPTPSGLG